MGNKAPLMAEEIKYIAQTPFIIERDVSVYEILRKSQDNKISF